MFHSKALMLVAGAAIFALDASAASAQDTTMTRRPTSTKRIPIAKEAHGEVVTATPVVARVDTVTVFKTDTLRLQGRVDTVTTTNTVTRTDTVVNTVNLGPRMIGGMYFGLAGGTALPYGSIRSVNNAGGLGQLNIGWQGIDSPIGIRGDVTYTQYAEAPSYASLGAKPDVWNANLDLKLEIPLFRAVFGSSSRFRPYLVGGGSYLRYRALRMRLEDGTTGGLGPQNALLAGGDQGWHDSFGWNAGGGLAWHFGSKEIFIESRAIVFNGADAASRSFGSAKHVPIAFGVNFF